MAGKGTPPYALFILPHDASLEAINHKLSQASNNENWDLHLTTDTYADAPKKRTDNGLNDGTKPPVKSFPIPSPFAGKTIEEAAEWLKAAPDEVDLDRRFFAVLDNHSSVNDTLTIARIGDGGVEGVEGDVQYFPVSATETAIYLNSMTSNTFDERLQSYQHEQQRSRKVDLSKGDPYNGPWLNE